MGDAYERERVWYASHHRHPVNRWLHACTVPWEWVATTLVASSLGAQAASAQAAAVCAVAAAPCAAIAVAVARSRRRASLATPAAAAVAFHAATAAGGPRAWRALVKACGASTPTALLACAGVNALAWGIQVGVGHWMVERNQPGMASNLTLTATLTSVLLAWDAPPTQSTHGNSDAKPRQA